MPELPEVEVCRLGISPHIIDQSVVDVVVRNSKLRWPIPKIVHSLVDHKVLAVERRSKYLLLRFEFGTLLLHLGMSGTIRIIADDTPVAKHDHFDLVLDNKKVEQIHCELNETQPA